MHCSSNLTDVRDALNLQKVILALRLNLIPCCASDNRLIVLCDQGVVLRDLLLLLLAKGS